MAALDVASRIWQLPLWSLLPPYSSASAMGAKADIFDDCFLENH
jgi:hypothetical protein